MITAARLRQYRQALNAIIKHGQDALEKEIVNLEATGASDEVIRDYFVQRNQEITESYGNAAAVQANALYEEVRADAGYSDVFTTSLPPSFPRRDVAALQSVKSAMLYAYRDEDYDKVIRQLQRALDRAAMRSTAASITFNGSRDRHKVKFARVPGSSESCAFCIMLASRGFEYWSAESAGANDHWHAHCECLVVPGFDGITVIEGYDKDALYDAWRDAQRTVGAPFSGKASYGSAVTRELERRDPAWIRTGKVPKITYEGEKLRANIIKNYPHQIRTAERLAQHGYQYYFQTDEFHSGGKTIGLADGFISGKGWEIKTLQSASKESTIDSHLRNAAEKVGMDVTVIDGAEAVNLSDNRIEEIIKRRMGARGVSEVLQILKDGSLRIIK